MEIVTLTEAVRKAIREETGHVFDRVIIETEAPSSTGIFHLKIRHLDDFLRYFRDKNECKGELVKAYLSSKSLDPTRDGFFEIITNYSKISEDIIRI
jgi:hypothetical protein